MRSGGRRCNRCVNVGPPAATITPAGQPSRMIAETEKTNPSVTPPALTPSTGTGKRSASAMLAMRPKRAATSDAVRGASTYSKIATPTVTAPATITGATTAKTLGRIPAMVVVSTDRCWSPATDASPTRRAGAYQPKLWAPTTPWPNTTASTAAKARRVTRRDFHSSIVPPGTNGRRTPDGRIVGAAAPTGNHPKEVAASPKGGNAGNKRLVLGVGLEPPPAQRAATPPRPR